VDRTPSGDPPVNDDLRLLFDHPGPQTRRRIRITTGASLLVIVALLTAAVRQFAVHGQLDADQWSMFTRWPVIRFLLDGAGRTLLVAGTAAALALPLGAAAGLLGLSRRRAPRAAVRSLMELLRATPLLLLLYAFLFGLPSAGVLLPVFWQLTVPIVLSNAAVIAELFRAGLLAQDRGQTEAALSLGMTHAQAMRRVVLPQATRHLMPALVGQLVRLLKDSTLGYVVSFLELLHKTRVLGEYYHTLLPSYLVTAACYVLINTALSQAATRLERRTRKN